MNNSLSNLQGMVKFQSLNKWYGDFHALKDIDLSIHKGEIVVVCGPSGSGKSTLIPCINQLEPFDSAELTVLENLTLAPIRTLKKIKLFMHEGRAIAV
ncbi:hypothetical protein BCT44_00065 [Vibrio breoganii]|nr:hypothetical protein BCT44_00065 [Vibrio breoganii]